LINFSTASVFIKLGADRWPAYALTKNAGTLALQIMTNSVAAEDMQVIQFHPGLVRTEGLTDPIFTPEAFQYEDGKRPAEPLSPP
jgi:NAD(P)-dependent dehydrogenase (short-subunit alcohol dehydrogenase family)